MSKAIKEITVPIDKVTSIAGMMQTMREPGANKLEFIILMLKALQLAVESDKLKGRNVMRSIAFTAQNMVDNIYRCVLELPEDDYEYYLKKFS